MNSNRFVTDDGINYKLVETGPEFKRLQDEIRQIAGDKLESTGIRQKFLKERDRLAKEKLQEKVREKLQEKERQEQTERIGNKEKNKKRSKINQRRKRYFSKTSL